RRNGVSPAFSRIDPRQTIISTHIGGFIQQQPAVGTWRAGLDHHCAGDARTRREDVDDGAVPTVLCPGRNILERYPRPKNPTIATPASRTHTPLSTRSSRRT